MGEPFFVVGSGRCGSLSLALTLNQHPLLCVMHEPYAAMIPASWARTVGRDCLSTLEMADGQGWIVDWLREVVPRPAGPQVVGIVDQKLAAFIVDLGAAFPGCRVIWLVRDGRRVVASGMARGWYTEAEERDPPHLWAAYRWRGDLAGELSRDEWAQMDAFARNCWYWAAVQRRIRAGLAEASATVRWLGVKLEELTTAKADEIQQWLGVSPQRLQVAYSNASGAAVRAWDPEGWSEEQRATFAAWCGEEMERIGYTTAN